MSRDLTRSFNVFRKVLADTTSITSAAEGAVAVLGDQPELRAWLRACFDALFDNMSDGLLALPTIAPPDGIPGLAGAILINPNPPAARVERSLDAVEQLLEWTRTGATSDGTGRRFAAALGLGLEQELPLVFVLEVMRADGDDELVSLIDQVQSTIYRGDSMASALRTFGADGELVAAVERGEQDGTLDRELLVYAARTC